MDCPLFCVCCDKCKAVVAAEHRLGDERFGRDWRAGNGCGCSACAWARANLQQAESHERHHRMEDASKMKPDNMNCSLCGHDSPHGRRGHGRCRHVTPSPEAADQIQKWSDSGMPRLVVLRLAETLLALPGYAQSCTCVGLKRQLTMVRP